MITFRIFREWPPNCHLRFELRTKSACNDSALTHSLHKSWHRFGAVPVIGAADILSSAVDQRCDLCPRTVFRGIASLSSHRLSRHRMSERWSQSCGSLSQLYLNSYGAFCTIRSAGRLGFHMLEVARTRARMISLLGVFLFLLQLSTRLFLLRIFRLFLAALGLVGRRMRLGRRIGRIRTVPPRLWQLWLLLFLALFFWPGQRLLAAFSSPEPPFGFLSGLFLFEGSALAARPAGLMLFQLVTEACSTRSGALYSADFQ